jgi:isoquinoline 1-oxidoreductase subunit beta
MFKIETATVAPAKLSKPSRRKFMQQTATLGGGLVIGFYLTGGNKIASAQAGDKKPVTPPNAFLRVGRDGIVTVQVKHLEFGQGVMTALPMLVAEELECEWQKVRAELAPAAPQFAHTMFGMQMTGGSSSVINSWEQLRMVGAMGRTMLISAAAQRWKVDAAKCKASDGQVIGPANQRLSFGELAEVANALSLPENVALKDAKDYKIIGKPTRRTDAPAKVNGTALFGMDMSAKTVPNLHTALVVHPPIFGAKVKSFDAEKVKGLPGVTHVVQVSGGVAVVAKSFWAAKKGRDALVVDWDTSACNKFSSADLAKTYAETAKTVGLPFRKGAAADNLKTAAKTVSAAYAMPFLAHAAMEPLNCTVHVKADSAEIWVGSQFQTVDQGAAAKVLGMPVEKVKLNTLIAGGGFGRRANPASDYIIEAVEIAQAAKVPVKTVWTREDDIKGGYYRPAYAHNVEIGLDAKGDLTAWQHNIVGQSILSGTPFEAFMVKDGIDATSVEGVGDTPYNIPNMAASLHTTKTGVPVLWWRSVGHTHTAFVMETMMDEAAKAAGKDPVEYRKNLLAKHPRIMATLALVAEKSGWGQAAVPAVKGRGRGIAVHESFGSVCAQVAEVSIENGAIRVHKVVAAIDCGLVVNPLTVEAQVESAIVYGLSAALGGAITFKDGVVEQSNFHNYPPLRMDAMPKIEVHIVPGGKSPTGVGEPGTPPIAPAVANAVFALTGKRLRAMPFVV